MTPDELFEAVAAELEGDPAVTPAKMFGSPGLKTGKKFFACLYQGKLVVKLSEERVDELAATGKGGHFDPGMGRVMREWAAVEPTTAGEWIGLAEEARSFVARG